MTQVLSLGGKFFTHPTETTARQDGWMLAQCEDAGVMRFAGRKEMDEASATALVLTIFRSGKMFAVLAGALVEVGEKWSVESATANAEHFAEITDPAEKLALTNALVPTLTLFFLGALPSSVASPNASTGAAERKRPRRKRATRSTETVPVASGAELPEK